MTRRPALLIACACLLATPLAQAYEAVEVSGGGSVTGAISVGAPRDDETKTIEKDTSHCGESMPAEKYVISSAGRVQNAVVIIDGIEKGKAPPTEDLVVSNDGCRFVPHVVVAPKGGMMKVRNEDPILHNSHFYLVSGEKKRNVINLALPKQGLEIGKKKILRKSGLLSLECDAHSFMQGWVWVLDHPYATVTGADGTFTIDGIPPGKHKMRVWHEGLGEKIIDVNVSAGKPTPADVSF